MDVIMLKNTNLEKNIDAMHLTKTSFEYDDEQPDYLPYINFLPHPPKSL